MPPFALRNIIGDLRQALPSAFDEQRQPPPRATPLLPTNNAVGSARTSAELADIIVAEEPIETDPGGDQQIEAAVLNGGLDYLAWYRSFHYGIDTWGIYFKEEGLYFVANRVFGSIREFDFPYRAQLAFRMLHRHE